MSHSTVSVKPGPARGSAEQTSLGQVRDVPPRSQQSKKAWARITTPFLSQRSWFTIVWMIDSVVVFFFLLALNEIYKSREGVESKASMWGPPQPLAHWRRHEPQGTLQFSNPLPPSKTHSHVELRSHKVSTNAERSHRQSGVLARRQFVQPRF